jgi:hypothetical protein
MHLLFQRQGHGSERLRNQRGIKGAQLGAINAGEQGVSAADREGG